MWMMEQWIVAEYRQEVTAGVEDVASLAQRSLSDRCLDTGLQIQSPQAPLCHLTEPLVGILQPDRGSSRRKVCAQMNPDRCVLNQRLTFVQILIQSQMTQLVTRVGCEQYVTLGKIGGQVA